MMIRLALLAFLVARFCSIEIRAQEEGRFDATDCAAMLSELKRSYESVDTFDLLLTYEVHEKGEGIDFTTKRASRIAHDPSAEFLSITSFTVKTDNLSQLARDRAVALLIDSEFRRYADFVAPPKELQKQTFDTYFEIADVANAFLVGVTFFPDATHVREKVDEDWQSVIGTVGTYGKVSIERQKVLCDVISPLKSSGLKTRWKFTFDPLKSLPTKYSCFYLVGDQEKLRYQSSISWGEPMRGIYLPLTIHTKEAGPKVNSKGNRVPVERTSTVELNWISVNDELAPSLWDKRRLVDASYAEQFLQAPQKNR